MSEKNPYNIMMYSHDSYGLGHMRRTMAIADKLRSIKTNIIILTGSPLAGRFPVAKGIDFVRIPGMIKKSSDGYFPLSMKIDANLVLNIRKKIILATAKAFQPHLFIVDKETLGLKKEVLPTLKWLKKCCPNTYIILGLRDIIDDTETVQKDWGKKRIYDALDRYYSEIWVYGRRSFYDPITEYNIPEPIRRKIHFAGYIPREKISGKGALEERKRHGIGYRDKLVVVTAGGGGDGFHMMNAYLTMLERPDLPISHKSILITGPFLPAPCREEILRRSQKLHVRVFQFYRQMERIMAAADLVISMGGYNTVCELMSQRTVSLLVPRETPRLEQSIRAQCFKQKGLLDYVAFNKLTPELLHKKIEILLNAPQFYQDAMARFKMTGYDNMCRRVQKIQRIPA